MFQEGKFPKWLLSNDSRNIAKTRSPYKIQCVILFVKKEFALQTVNYKHFDCGACKYAFSNRKIRRVSRTIEGKKSNAEKNAIPKKTKTQMSVS